MKEATKDLAEVICELEKECTEHPDSVFAHHHLGLAYRQAGRLDDAVRELEKAIEIDPYSVEGLINLGSVYFDVGQMEKALKVNTTAAAIMPTAAQAHANIGLIHQHLGNIKESITAYNEAIKHDAKMVTAWVNLTSVLTMAGENDKALKAAKCGVELDDTFGMAHNNLAVACYLNDDLEAAGRHARRARELGYQVDPRFLKELEGFRVQ